MKQLAALLLVVSSLAMAQINSGLNLDTVKAQQFDMGKMWTFENPPIEYFKQEYNFEPSDEWLEHTQKASLRFVNFCSASFVSGDGLIMTNHHCARGALPNVEREGENLLRDGFYAPTREQERKMPDWYVDQLVQVEDVTAQIQDAMSTGKNDSEKVQIKNNLIASIEKEKSESSGYMCKVTSLYNGGKYSLYYYKRYNDIRLVFAPDIRAAKFGGDYDNFTYPRFGLDFAFFRAYENDKPLKIRYYFQWSQEGVKEGDAVFIVGNPGNTDRINTMSQIYYQRDVQYPMLTGTYKKLYDILLDSVKRTNAEDYKVIARLYSVGNGLKVFTGTLKALQDNYLLARKADFEKKFRKAVNADPKLKSLYGGLWDEIKTLREEAAKLAPLQFAYNITSLYSPSWLIKAQKIVQLLNTGLPNEELALKVDALLPETENISLNKKYLEIQIGVWTQFLPANHPVRASLLGGKTGREAVEYILANSSITERKKIIEAAAKGENAVKALNDPFISFVTMVDAENKQVRARLVEINKREEIINQELGKALYAVYGASIPPDATFTLRLADGIVSSYSYNGTKAPVKTTFYGILDKYYAFDGEFPFNLSEKWKSLPAEFDLSTPLNFISTNDIVGGNSGSPVINKKAQIVGLAFDGNIESLPSNLIYTTEANRTVSVDARGILEAIEDLYGAKLLGKELRTGRAQ